MRATVFPCGLVAGRRLCNVRLYTLQYVAWGRRRRCTSGVGGAADQDGGAPAGAAQRRRRRRRGRRLGWRAGYARLELQPPADERFHRIYRRNHASHRWVILHLYDLSACDDANADPHLRREYDEMRRLQQHAWAPRIVDTFQEAPSDPGELACRARLWYGMTTCRASMSLSTRVLDHLSGSSDVGGQRRRGALCPEQDRGMGHFRQARRLALYRLRSFGPVPRFPKSTSPPGVCAAPQRGIRER